MDFWDIWPYIYWGGLVFTRLSGVLYTAPPFSSRGIPVPVGTGTAAVVALLLVPVLPNKPVPAGSAFEVALAVSRELLVGLGMGFSVSLLFNAVYVAGQLIDVPMGFGMVNVLDPNSGEQVPIFAQFQFILATLVFLAVGGHRLMLLALARSFELVPLAGAAAGRSLTEAVLESFVQMFLVGVNLALPVIGALLLTDVALGIVARAVPQINVFIVGFPLKIAVGLGLMVGVMPIYVVVLERLFSSSGVVWRYVERFLAAMVPGGT